MNLSLVCLACLLAIVGSASGAEPEKAPAAPAHPQVRLETSKGNIVLELYPDKAPKTVENFLQYVKSGFYDGTIFHRVIPDFMIQGGGFTSEMTQKPTKAPIQNEADNRVLNERGTVAMARTGDPNSATAQFFINLKNNGFLNFTGKTASGWGYTVFGKVVEGLDVVDAIAQVPTGRKGSYENVPAQPVVIKKATIVHAKK
ncbi:MAG TPA: peptidylprolyl isomerase [Thermoanaerobaculia bacterium]|jgi:cyclophilin family peptidyl-prolyl cis-trans isomerase|nr:peptidylprolyl isomerase [Thermoanaerobaculia bacterium]